MGCCGDVAQMGERCVRNAQAEGSNPFISTKSPLEIASIGWYPPWPFQRLIEGCLVRVHIIKLDTHRPNPSTQGFLNRFQSRVKSR